MNKLQFLDECRFAKMVSTPAGTGILVAGVVFNVSAPEGLEFDATEALVTALRNSQHVGLPSAPAGVASGVVQGAATNPAYFGFAGKAQN